MEISDQYNNNLKKKKLKKFLRSRGITCFTCRSVVRLVPFTRQPTLLSYCHTMWLFIFRTRKLIVTLCDCSFSELGNLLSHYVTVHFPNSETYCHTMWLFIFRTRKLTGDTHQPLSSRRGQYFLNAEYYTAAVTLSKWYRICLQGCVEPKEFGCPRQA